MKPSNKSTAAAITLFCIAALGCTRTSTADSASQSNLPTVAGGVVLDNYARWQKPDVCPPGAKRSELKKITMGKDKEEFFYQYCYQVDTSGRIPASEAERPERITRDGPFSYWVAATGKKRLEGQHIGGQAKGPWTTYGSAGQVVEVDDRQ